MILTIACGVVVFERKDVVGCKLENQIQGKCFYIHIHCPLVPPTSGTTRSAVRHYLLTLSMGLQFNCGAAVGAVAYYLDDCSSRQLGILTVLYNHGLKLSSELPCNHSPHLRPGQGIVLTD